MDAIRQQLMGEFVLGQDSLHGPRHWRRVEVFGLHLCPETGADPAVVSWFAWFHDCARENEARDPDHGARGALRAERWRGQVGLDDEAFEKLLEACRGHEKGWTSDDVTIGTCWDADRLDLDRVLVPPSVNRMSTEAGKRLAVLAQRQRWERVGLRAFRAR